MAGYKPGPRSRKFSNKAIVNRLCSSASYNKRKKR